VRYFAISTPPRKPSRTLLARAKKLAAERPAARSRRLADHGRAQCRDRRYQAQPQAGAGCPTTRQSPISTMPKTRWPNGSTARITATTFCGYCHLLSPRPAGDAADRAGAAIVSGLTVNKIARAFLVSEARWSNASPRQARVADADCRSSPGRGGSAPYGSPRLRVIYLIFTRVFASGTRGNPRPLCEEAIPAGAAVAAACSRASPRSGSEGGCCCCSMPALRRASTAAGTRVLQTDQAGALWNQKSEHRGVGPDRPSHCAIAAAGPYQVQAAIGALHARAAKPEAPTGPRSIALGAL